MAEERVRALERQLEEVSRQRDALERDVEALCMQNGEFSGSEVLGNRISHLEQSLRRSEGAVASVSRERDSLREDINQQKLAKRTLDTALKEEVEKNSNLEKELQYYLVQSGSIIAERDSSRIQADRAVAEATAARRDLSAAQADLESMRETMETLRSERDSYDQRCIKLAAQAAESTKLEPLRRELEEVRAKLEAQVSETAGERQKSEALAIELEGARRETGEERAERERLSKELADLGGALEMMKDQKKRDEVDRLLEKEKLKRIKDDLEEVREARDILEALYKGSKVKLAQATAEKVDAMLRLSNAVNL